MGKSGAAWGASDNPRQDGWQQGIGMANSDMSNGKMGSACKHYMKAQKAAMAK